MLHSVVFLLLLPLLGLTQAGNLVQELQNRGQFNTFLEIAEKVGLLRTLSSSGFANYTVFAPTDEAFTKRAKERGARAESTLEELKQVVRYHVVPGLVWAITLQDDGSLTSLGGNTIRTNVYYQKAFTTYKPEGKFIGSFDNTAVLVDSQNGDPLIVTLFDKTYTINGAKVKKADIEASNGLIYIMEDTIDPPPNATIADLIAADPRLSTFLSLLTAAELSELLYQPGPYTVFAPTNAAIAAMPEKELEALSANPAALLKLVGKHIIPGNTWFKEGMLLGVTDKTLAGSEAKDKLIMEKGANGGVQVGSIAANATVIQADIQGTNGVLHVIDTVL